MKYKLLGLAIFFGITLSGIAKAICPVCVVAVGAGLGFSRWLGVDDVVSSIWIGALLFALSVWTIIWLGKKGWSFKYDGVVIFLAYYLLTLVPLYYADIVGHPLNKIWGIDKIIFGSAIGTITFVLSYLLHNYLKKKNGGKSFFPYQKVVLPVAITIIVSIIFYLLITLKWI
ncbi:MAG: hypothetical protein NTW11_01910 [Candidatus Staskawiczbacteria bacterium]|nr:hypothetical protein [Candidatus Staskawiczbacteria bacterium]